MSKKNNNKAQEIITKRWKLLQANALDNNKAVESAKKLMEISNKLVPKMPKTLLINEQINSMINQHIPTVQAPTNQIATIIEKSAIQQLNVCSESITQTLSTSVSNIISQIAEVQMQFMNSIVEVINKSISPALKTLYNVLEEALNNPDSRINWMNYYDKLSNFYWIMPYKVTTEELHEILQYIETEKEFDKYINKYFTKTKLINEKFSLKLLRLMKTNHMH